MSHAELSERAREQDAEVDKILRKPVNESSFRKAVRSMVDYLYPEEEPDWREMDGPLKHHIFGSVLIAEAWLDQQKKQQRKRGGNHGR